MRVENPLLRLLLGYLLVMAACFAAIRLGGAVPALEAYQSFLVALVFLYSPLWLLRWTGPLPSAAPLSTRARLRSGLQALGLALVVFPPFTVATLALAGCPWGALLPSPQPSWFLWELASQFLLVAFPEEFFYRGFLQQHLKRLLPAWRPLLGVSCWPALALTSLLFALGHLLAFPSPERLLVFFPSLLFGWLRERSGSLGGPALFHTLCNVLQATLGRMIP
jgi:membrane protease YdiL (CAAX protease family)